MKNSSKDFSIAILLILTVVMTAIGVTFSYFTVKMTSTSTEGSTITTATIGNITFDGGSDFTNNTNIEPGWSQTKTFSITAPASSVSRTVYIRLDYTNTFTDLTWSLTGTGANSEITGTIPKVSDTTVTLVTLSVPASSTSNVYTYSLNVEFPNKTDVNQNYDQGKTFTGTLYADFGENIDTIYYNNTNKTGTTTIN